MIGAQNGANSALEEQPFLQGRVTKIGEHLALNARIMMKSEQPIELHLEEYGPDGQTTLVFVPGLGGTTSYWRGHLGPLTDHYRTVLVDPLGFGDSPKPWTRYTVDAHVDALYQTLHPYAPFILVGHSMGTLLSLACAVRYPADVDGLVLISLPYYGNREKAMRTIRSSSPIYRVFLGNVVLAAVICMISRRLYRWLAPYAQTYLPKEVAADIVKHSWRSFTSSLWEVIYNHDAALDALDLDPRIPVLCIHGDQDTVAPLTHARLLVERFPHWQMQILRGADHHPLFKAPNATQRAIATRAAQVSLPKGEGQIKERSQ